MVKIKNNALIIFCVLIVILQFTSCKAERTTDENASDNLTTTSINETTNADSSLNYDEQNNDSIVSESMDKAEISKIIVEILNIRTEQDINEDILNFLASAKKSEEIEVNNSLTEIGVLYTINSDGDKETEFGKIYSDVIGHIYLSAKDNAQYAIEIKTDNGIVSTNLF